MERNWPAPDALFPGFQCFVSASNAGSNIEKLVQLIIRCATAVASDLAVEEAGRNILAKRPQWAGSFEEIILKLKQVDSISFPLPVRLDEKDVPLLCSAIRSECDYFVTGNKRDFGHVFGKTVQGGQIVSLLQMANILLNK